MTKETDKNAIAAFWRVKKLDEMNDAEWESLCDGCGRCCLNKLEDAESGRIAYTDIACALLDSERCRCRDYPNRSAVVPTCVRLSVEEVRTLSWLPATCAYRLINEGRDLYDWHPLVSGDPDSVHTAGVSVRGRAVREQDWPEVASWEDRIVTWPNRLPGALGRIRRKKG